MSQDQFDAFVEHVKGNPELLEKLQAVETEEELRSVAAELGYHFASENLIARVSDAYSELSPSELEQVAGGASAEQAWGGQSSVCTSMCKLTCGGSKYCPEEPGSPKGIV